MTPMDILIVVLIVFNVLIGIVMLFVLVQVALLARKINRTVDSVTEAVRFVQRLEFLPSALVHALLDRFLGKNK